MSDLGLNSTLTAQKLALNLNMSNLSSASKLQTLSDGFHDEADTIYGVASSTLDNMFVNTASQTYLESMGYQEGLYRIKEPKIRLHSSDQIAYMYISDTNLFNSSLNYTGQFLKAGDTFIIASQNIQLNILEDVFVTDLTVNTRVYISLDILSYNSNSYSMSANSDTDLNTIPPSLTRVCSAVTFGLAKDIAIPIVTEDLNNFRSRVSYAKNTSKYGTEGAIRLAIASNPLVTDYYINYDTYPYKVSVLNINMQFDNTYDDYLHNYVIPSIETQIILRRCVGSSFTIDTPKAISFYPKILDVNNVEQALDLSDFRAFVSSIYVLGTQLTLNKNVLTSYLLSTGFTLEQLPGLKLQWYKYKSGFSYLSAESSIVINKDEYPFVIVPGA